MSRNRNNARQNVIVVGMGYVGLANAIGLSHDHNVSMVDIDEERVRRFNEGLLPIDDVEMQQVMDSGTLKLTAGPPDPEAYRSASIVVIATPTDYDPSTDYFDTSSVEGVVTDVASANPQATIVIKSTVPVGFTQEIQRSWPKTSIVFSPEFLREGRALKDVWWPSRIIVGGDANESRKTAELFLDASRRPDVPVLLVNSNEAEAIKLFSNTFLALRIAYFNEMDTYALSHGLNVKDLIEGVGLDPRIGLDYNNPSFGYGGYCLPKDTKQLLASYQDIPQNLIAATIDANQTRKQFIVDDVLQQGADTVGIFRLAMKQGSDNFRDSAVLEVAHQIKSTGAEVLVYEPNLGAQRFQGLEVVKNLSDFKRRSELILANRYSEDLADVAFKVYTRDVFLRD